MIMTYLFTNYFDSYDQNKQKNLQWFYYYLIFFQRNTVSNLI